MHTALEAVAKARSARNDGHLAEARRHYAEAAELYRAQNDELGYAHAIRHLADIYGDEANLLAAKPLYEEALEIYRGSLQTKILDLANTIRPFAFVNEQLGNQDLAQELWREAKQLYRSLRIEAGESECDAHLRKFS